MVEAKVRPIFAKGLADAGLYSLLPAKEMLHDALICTFSSMLEYNRIHVNPSNATAIEELSKVVNGGRIPRHLVSPFSMLVKTLKPEQIEQSMLLKYIRSEVFLYDSEGLLLLSEYSFRDFNKNDAFCVSCDDLGTQCLPLLKENLYWRSLYNATPGYIDGDLSTVLPCQAILTRLILIYHICLRKNIGSHHPIVRTGVGLQSMLAFACDFMAAGIPESAFNNECFVKFVAANQTIFLNIADIVQIACGLTINSAQILKDGWLDLSSNAAISLCARSLATSLTKQANILHENKVTTRFYYAKMDHFEQDFEVASLCAKLSETNDFQIIWQLQSFREKTVVFMKMHSYPCDVAWALDMGCREAQISKTNFILYFDGPVSYLICKNMAVYESLVQGLLALALRNGLSHECVLLYPAVSMLLQSWWKDKRARACPEHCKLLRSAICWLIRYSQPASISSDVAMVPNEIEDDLEAYALLCPALTSLVRAGGNINELRRVVYALSRLRAPCIAGEKTTAALYRALHTENDVSPELTKSVDNVHPIGGPLFNDGSVYDIFQCNCGLLRAITEFPYVATAALKDLHGGVSSYGGCDRWQPGLFANITRHPQTLVRPRTTIRIDSFAANGKSGDLDALLFSLESGASVLTKAPVDSGPDSVFGFMKCSSKTEVMDCRHVFLLADFPLTNENSSIRCFGCKSNKIARFCECTRSTVLPYKHDSVLTFLMENRHGIPLSPKSYRHETGGKIAGKEKDRCLYGYTVVQRAQQRAR
jgi:hypothetical protein